VIAKLTGKIDWLGEASAIVDVGGVGYLVHCPARTMRALPPVGGVAAISIETVVREDAITLYGFVDPYEREWFRLLQTVQGVGAKVALAILSTLSVAELARAILVQDKSTISRAPGVGPKLAQRLALELKDKSPAGAMVPHGTAPLAVAAPAPPSGAAEEAISALVNLGYRRPEATDAVAGAYARLGDAAATATLIRDALKALGK
jgi:Holliday junction DNA helicase RuvA